LKKKNINIPIMPGGYVTGSAMNLCWKSIAVCTGLSSSGDSCMPGIPRSEVNSSSSD